MWCGVVCVARVCRRVWGQILAPSGVNLPAFADLAYCHAATDLSDRTDMYQTDAMQVASFRAVCLEHGNAAFGGVLYPRDELNAMYIVTAVTTYDSVDPAGSWVLASPYHLQ